MRIVRTNSAYVVYVRSISIPNFLPCLHRPSACDFQSRALEGLVTETKFNPVPKSVAKGQRESSNPFLKQGTWVGYTPWKKRDICRDRERSLSLRPLAYRYRDETGLSMIALLCEIKGHPNN